MTRRPSSREDGPVLKNVVGDTSTMPEYVRVQVQRVQQRLHDNEPLELDEDGFVPRVTIGARAPTRRPLLEDYQRPRVQFFLPEIECGCPRPKCPVCTTNDHTVVKGWMCRRVVDTKDTYFIVYRRFACSTCRAAPGRPETTYGPWTPSVYADMQKEHSDICDDLGIVFTAKNAVTEEVMDYITHHATGGLSFAKQAEYFKGLHHKRAHRMRKKYLRAVKRWRQRNDDDLEAEEWSQFEKSTLAFSDPTGYNGYTPGAEYFAVLYIKHVLLSSEAMRLRMQMVDAQILAGDACAARLHCAPPT